MNTPGVNFYLRIIINVGAMRDIVKGTQLNILGGHDICLVSQKNVKGTLQNEENRRLGVPAVLPPVAETSGPYKTEKMCQQGALRVPVLGHAAGAEP